MPFSRSHKLWLKARLLRAKEWFVRAFFSYGEPELLAALRDVGVRPGDSLMLHSSFKGENGFRGSIDELIHAFTTAVGPQGTLLMVSLPYRSSTLDYLNNGKLFDVRRTPSMMGMVSEMFRRRPDVRRSPHPTHPVLAGGKRAAWFIEGHDACRFACGPDSPFEKLAEVDGLVVFFNVPFETFTFFHYLEHLIRDRLPFDLYIQGLFAVDVMDESGTRRSVSTYAFAPEAIRRRRPSILEEALRRRGALHERRLGFGRVQAVRVRDSIDCVTEMAREGRFFYDMTDTP